MTNEEHHHAGHPELFVRLNALIVEFRQARKREPAEVGVVLAIRTVRRYLQHNLDIDVSGRQMVAQVDQDTERGGINGEGRHGD